MFVLSAYHPGMLVVVVRHAVHGFPQSQLNCHKLFLAALTLCTCALHQVAEHEVGGDFKQNCEEPEQSKAKLPLIAAVLGIAL